MELKNYYAQDNAGNILPAATCHLYLAGTETLASGLVDASGTPLPNPFLSHADGLVQFAAPNGRYDLHIAQGGHVKRLRIQCNDVAGNVLKSELADPAQGAAMIAYEDGTVAEKLAELSQSGGGLLAGLPFFEVTAVDGEVHSESFALPGIYRIAEDSGDGGASARVFLNMGALHPRAFITGFGPIAIYGTFDDERYLLGLLSAGDVWSIDLGGKVLGSGAGSLTRDPDYELNQHISLWNETDPGQTFIVSNKDEHPSVTLTLPAPTFGEVGYEYHVISNANVPVYLEYEDGTGITTADGYLPQLRTRYSVATLKKITDDKWIVFGDLSTAGEVT